MPTTEFEHWERARQIQEPLLGKSLRFAQISKKRRIKHIEVPMKAGHFT